MNAGASMTTSLREEIEQTLRCNPCETEVEYAFAHLLREAAAALSTPPAEGMVKAARELYMAGRWDCDGIPQAEQVRLWEALRDALGLPAGTATAAGVDAAMIAATEGSNNG